ncbi:MAG TPA: dockerin type I domain-containing protein [Chthoniobacterales bacterium]|nr:dockerin type I domain-containing protein [Chthoniobacterales bacterium]
MKTFIRSIVGSVSERCRVLRIRPHSVKTFGHLLISVLLLSLGVALGFVAMTHPNVNGKPLRLAYDHPQNGRPSYAPIKPSKVSLVATPAAPAVNAPTFGHPIVSGIQGTGFEADVRVDPSNPSRIYESVPGSESSDTSWIWQSLDSGLTFKWVPAATAYEGKATPPCAGGGDAELGIAINGSIYFCDLTLANFSVARSDDLGATFPCSNTGVPDAVVDRQWYTFDGDPLNGGSIYLTNDEVAQSPTDCGGAVTNFGQNIMVMYRSPVSSNAATTAGLVFGPANKVSNPMGCDEGIMGNDEVSPIATTLGQPDGAGGYTILSEPVKHVFVVHDNAALNTIMIGRCFPVAFGAPTTNVSDPSGLNCVDLTVANLGASAKTGANFPTLAIDAAGNLYAVWEVAPINASGQVTGDTVLQYSFSTDQGNTWSAPITIDTSGSPVGTLHTNAFAWIAAGDDGRVGIAWYGTPGQPPFPSNGPDSCGSNCDWSLWYVMSANAHSTTPTFTAPVQASEHFVHRGSQYTLIGGQTGDRTQGDFLQMRMGARGEAEISYSDSNNVDEIFAPHAMFVRQNGGFGLLAASSPINVPGLTPFNSVTDPTGDATFQASGTTSASMSQLDITGSNISITTSAPCSAVSPCYRVEMDINNLSLAPTTTSDPDTDLVWNTQWLVPSSTDPNGGKNFFVYGESANGGALQCYYGENSAIAVGGGVALTYPGKSTALPAANCQSTLGPNGNIVIYVPQTNVFEAGAIDNKLHEVVASTMTLQGPANAVQPEAGLGGSLFNLIDVAQTYVFDPGQVTFTKVVSRKQHGTAGTFDIELSQNGSSADECRSGGVNGDYQLVVTFLNPIAAVAGGSVTSGTGHVDSVSVSGSNVTINLSGVTTAQRLVVTLTGVNDGTTVGTAMITMPVLVGDTTNNGAVNSSDIAQTQSQSGQPVTSTNFREDVTANGAINSSDIALVQSQSGTALP